MLLSLSVRLRLCQRDKRAQDLRRADQRDLLEQHVSEPLGEARLGLGRCEGRVMGGEIRPELSEELRPRGRRENRCLSRAFSFIDFILIV